MIPKAELGPVDRTPFDFRKATAAGEFIKSDDQQLRVAGGYDHHWVLRDEGPRLGEVAEVYDPASGAHSQYSQISRASKFYSGNFLDGSIRVKSGKPMQIHAGLCLETQRFPGSPEPV